MDHFNYRDNQLFAEDVAVTALIAKYGSPCYIYSRATFERHVKAFTSAFMQHDHLVCYAVKANSNLGVLDIMNRQAIGFDIVSQGELERVLTIGADPEKIVFSGVAKQAEDIKRALDVGIYCFNIESIPELHLIHAVAKDMGKIAPVALRVNPDVLAGAHPYISTGLKENKFGIDVQQAQQIYHEMRQMPHIKITGIDCHIGSQLTEISPFLDALDRLLILIDKLEQDGITLQHLDIGGGLGVSYHAEKPPQPQELIKAILQKVGKRRQKIIVEPGRAIAANAGIFVTKIVYLKETEYKNFAIVDGGMNDLMRPALYQAWQHIIPVVIHENIEPKFYDIVGPICETGDFLGKERELSLKVNDLLAVRGAGAYGFVMSSNYNSRQRAAEVMVDGDKSYLVRRRETIQELFANEACLP